MNQARNIKEVAKKWGLSFSTIQRVMSRKREHSVGGRQYAKKKVKEKKEILSKEVNELRRKVRPHQLRLQARNLWNPIKIPRTVRNFLMCLGHAPKSLKETSHNNQQNTDPELPLTLRSNPPTTRTVPQPMRPEPDLGMPPEAEPEQDNG